MPTIEALRRAATDFGEQALGRQHRDDPVLRGTGGPAGNARLTAWTGLVLLLLGVAELITLLDLEGLISWHIVIGVLLIPPALVKTVSTGWRIVRYYAGSRPYRRAGPPPLLLRVLGPLVVASTLAVLASGVVLILVSPDTARQELGGGLLALSLVNVHKGLSVVWAAATGAHTLGRLISALRLTVIPAMSRWVPGRAARTAALCATAVVAAVAAVLALAAATPWRAPNALHHDRPHRVTSR